MQNLDLVAEELFNKIRGRFPSVTIGDAEGNISNEPKQARYFDFDFMNEGRPVGKISISLNDKSIAVVYGEDLVANESDITKNNWYDFLKELRMFARKRALTFDTRDITKSNLNSRDYKFLAKNRGGDENMNESKLYGTSKVSYQDFDGARLMIKHTESIDQEAPGGRAKKVGSLYIESAEGERFKYPYKHLTGARAMTRHVAEGGNAYDDFGKHIVSMSEEMSKLRKFKSYMGRSAVMAESLSEYVDVVKARIATVKKTLESLQRPSYYKETFEAFAPAVMEDVPSDVAENWIDQLTIKQFNEELADVFPYIYKLVSEATKAQELSADDLMAEADDPCWKGYKQIGMKKKGGKEVPNCVPEELELESAFEKSMGQFAEKDTEEADDTIDVKMTPDGGIEKADKKEQKTPLGEFILSYFDRETGQFPKGETAILTMVEKDYGEEFIEPAKQFIEQINNKVAEVMGYRDTDMQEEDRKLNDADKKVMQKLTGMIKQKQQEMQDARKGGYDEDVRMIASQLEDFYSIAELIQGKRPMGLDTSVMDLVHDMYDEVGAKFGESNEELSRITDLAGL